MSTQTRPLFLAALALALPLALVATCATTSNPNAGKYPPRSGGCKLRVFHGLPDVKEWDDLGIAHADCQLDLGRVQCLQRLKTEACRMGGDILYDVPPKPLRPTDQGMVYTGHVAHTKATTDGGQGQGQGKDEEATGADESAFDNSGPVEPLAPAAAPPAAAPPAVNTQTTDGGPK
jgi:hypothetical protein